jgi:NAD(P)-dependent dehydrogenase (short-subunit alcohol dehydrogenase family)
VTGATSGIGRAVAGSLASSGLTVGIVARDAVRGERARAAIAEASGNDRVRLFDGDLSDLGSTRRLAAAVNEAFPALDVLVHCAAAYMSRRTVTANGLETMFATNYLGPFLLTNLLLDRLRAAPAARILVISAPSTVKLDFDDLQGERRFRSLQAFGATKTADLLFTFELARRLEGTNVTANAVHPGLVRTNLMRQAPAPLRWVTWFASAPASRAAQAITQLAIAPEFRGRSGRFFKDGSELEAPAYARDVAVAARLWDASVALTGLSAAS